MAETVLVVDYETNIRRLVVGLLEGAGYEVFDVDSAEGALTVLRNRKVDLLLCNAVMPEMSGVELALLGQEHRPEMKVLLTTGHLRDEKISAPGNTRLLEQPFRPDVLLLEIRRLLAPGAGRTGPSTG